MVSAKPDILVLAPWYRPAMDELEAHLTVHWLREAGDREALIAALAEGRLGAAGKPLVTPVD